MQDLDTVVSWLALLFITVPSQFSGLNKLHVVVNYLILLFIEQG